MALFKNHFSNVKTDENTGFGTNAARYGNRFINKDGSANVKRKGFNFFTRISWYHTMLEMSRWKFLGLLFLFFIGINFYLPPFIILSELNF